MIPIEANKWIQQGPVRMGQKFPLNLAAILPPELQQKIFRWMQDNYIWPQLQERMSFEPLWDKLAKLAKINLDAIDLNFALDTPAGKEQKDSGRQSPKVSDSCIFDAIDRLSNINHFISWKDGFPAQFVRPDYIEQPYETDVYSPLDRKIKGANALLNWNANEMDVYRSHLIGCRHHYTYGVSFVRSEFVFKIENVTRQNNFGQVIQQQEITKIGATYDPISIRRLWLNYRLPAWNMDAQPCPFLFEEMPYFAVLQNSYDPDMNPFGFANLDKVKLNGCDWLYSSQETESVRKAMETRLNEAWKNICPDDGAAPLPQILKPEYSVNALWTFYAMLPLDPNNGDWETRPDGTPVPLSRFIVQSYGQNLATQQIMLRLQFSYYPKNKLPIFGSAHMPDTDSGAYSPALGELLFNHYKEIVTCTNQFIANKDWVNNPPSWCQVSSPASNVDRSAPGADIKVNGPNDFGWRQPFDATASTVAMRTTLREECQTTSKAVDAILGKAMGGRTSATEASNAYQASMSGITTDINLYNYDLPRQFAYRVWDYFGLWVDPDLLYRITGSFGFAMKPEDMWISLDVQCNCGSNYIASIVRQQNLRYLGEIARGVPNIKMGNVFKALCKEMKLGNPSEFVEDGGWEHEVLKASIQAYQTYLGQPVVPSPDQNHDIAIRVKTAFIEDPDSYYNQEMPEGIPQLIKQIEMHQLFLQAQMQMQLATLQNAAIGEGGPAGPAIPGAPSGSPVPVGGVDGGGAITQGAGGTV